MKSATKFIVVILFIGVVCAHVDARKLEKRSKELMDQKLLSLPQLPSTPPLPIIPPMTSTLPTPITPAVPLPEPIPVLSEAVSAIKGGVEKRVGLVSENTKLSVSIPKTAATNGVGTELVVTVTSRATNSRYANDNSAGSGATGSTYETTYGSVTADGPNEIAYSRSTAYGRAGADAAAGPDGARGSGYSYGYAYTDAGGSIGNSNP